ncbi:N-acetyltransferase [Motiliproteus coralliicola]|uniref:N-acetyltransferase n=1 Tax=Motiliproteus coralliicola TaxID=2283196 RepID=A0A369WJQ1_9GAMM|nr:GNAT family N-acetyltransferase [Motiliproteus coralliicola]RDE19675.1 N-acetyltransferase [Motiliproteus coralliicola]
MGLSFASSRLSVSELTGSLTSCKHTSLLERIPKILTPPVVENLPPYFHGIDSKELAEIWLDRMLSESRLFLVTSVEGTLIGFLFASVENDTDAHIGYLLAEDYWGKGLASELLTGFIGEISNNESWVKLIAGVEESNVASANLLKRQGFIEQPNSGDGVVFFEYTISTPRTENTDG